MAEESSGAGYMPVPGAGYMPVPVIVEPVDDDNDDDDEVRTHVTGGQASSA
ncbi:unnamed protein product, partial [Lymnaea stagnalis]